MFSKKKLLPLLISFLVGCQAIEQPIPSNFKTTLDESINDHVFQETILKEEPYAVEGMELRMRNEEPIEKLIDVAAKNVNAQLFFASLIKDTDMNVMIHPGVKGRITLYLKQVTLKSVLEAIENMYGYNVTVNDNIMQVYPAEIRTEIFPVHYLFMKRKGISLTAVNSGRISDGDNEDSGSESNSGSGSEGGDKTNGTFIDSRTETDFWSELQHTLSEIVGTKEHKNKRVVVSPQSGLVSVHAYPHEIKNVELFLYKAVRQLKKQVILETKIMEVTLSDGYQQGIEWSKLNGSDSVGGHSVSSSGGFTGGLPLGDEITNILGGITSIKFSGTDFEAAINLMSTQGDVEVLSSPRITATNNQKAVIKVGQDEYFVTKVSSTTVASNTPITTPDVELTPFFSGIALDVTPQIDNKNRVLLHVHPSVIDVKEQLKTIKLSKDEIELPLAASQIRESDTVIEAKSGEIVVIGGLMKTEQKTMVSKVPLLGDIPLLGLLFQNKSVKELKTELVILLKPTVIEGDTWQSELRKSRNTVSNWYPKKAQLGGLIESR